MARPSLPHFLGGQNILRQISQNQFGFGFGNFGDEEGRAAKPPAGLTLSDPQYGHLPSFDVFILPLIRFS